MRYSQKVELLLELFNAAHIDNALKGCVIHG